MAFSVEYHRSVVKFLQKQDKEFAKKVLNTFDEIAMNTMQNRFDIKPLVGSPKNHFRLRIGKYRFLYEIFDEELLIYCYDADSRGGIYK